MYCVIFDGRCYGTFHLKALAELSIGNTGGHVEKVRKPKHKPPFTLRHERELLSLCRKMR